MLFAIVLGPTAGLVTLGFLLFGAVSAFCGAGIALLVQRLRPKASQTALTVSKQVKQAAFAAAREDLGFLTAFFDAIASNNMTALAEAAQELTFHLKSGTLADLLEDFVKRRIRVLMADEANRRELLDLVGELVGSDLHAMLATKKEKLPTARSLVPAIAFMALCLGASSMALAGPPERFEPTDRRVVIDPPSFPNAEVHAQPAVQYWVRHRRWFRRR
jgi:hypothetical protein